MFFPEHKIFRFQDVAFTPVRQVLLPVFTKNVKITIRLCQNHLWGNRFGVHWFVFRIFDRRGHHHGCWRRWIHGRSAGCRRCRGGCNRRFGHCCRRCRCRCRRWCYSRCCCRRCRCRCWGNRNWRWRRRWRGGFVFVLTLFFLFLLLLLFCGSGCLFLLHNALYRQCSGSNRQHVPPVWGYFVANKTVRKWNRYTL